MTDKSFGDTHNRNVVKNPLLSTAAMGLSIDDLTHNAVLLPVSLTQEVITRPDIQVRSQNRTLGHTEHAVSPQPADAISNLQQNPQAQQSITPPYDTPHQKTLQKPEDNTETLRSTLSKASVKSDDDFDVNEYFARLHGTRYVSAPLSVLKEDRNANLEATEENLEEINLNDPEKDVQQNVDVQQSLTADIAQNFSQLPTVLPQMASAVFSSFSNMLQTKRSREVTPEVSSGYQEVQFERPSEVQQMREPPKEPPMMSPSVGTSYRLPQRKKYAQIPGLSTGDTSHPYQPFSQMPSTNQQFPQYFTPSAVPTEPSQGNELRLDSLNANITPSNQSLQEPKVFTPSDTQNVHQRLHEGPKIFTPSAATGSPSPMKNETAQIDLNLTQNLSDIKESKETHSYPPQSNPSQLFGQQMDQINPVPQLFGQESQSSVLSPPPMFANQPRRDSQSAGKAVLPPSVARRIGANHPIIKRSHQPPSFNESYFIPTPIEASEVSTAKPESFAPSSTNKTSYTPFTAQMPPVSSNVSNIPPFSANISSANMATPPTSVPPIQASIGQSWANSSVPILSNISSGHTARPEFQDLKTQGSIAPPPLFATNTSISSSAPLASSNIQVPPIIAPPKLPSSKTEGTSSSIFTPTMTSAMPAATNMPLSNFESKKAMPQMFTPGETPTNTSVSSATTNIFPPSNVEEKVSPQIFTPDFVAQTTGIQVTSQPPPAFFNPGEIASNAESKVSPQFKPEVLNETSAIPGVPQSSQFPPTFFNPSAMMAENKGFPPMDITTPIQEPPKPVPEPPKASGNVNFRMTKKRPQYYSGPIEGVGAISNNVKPVIAPINTGGFPGALFTPQSDVVEASPSSGQYTPAPFDISRPAENPYSHIGPPQDYNTAFDMSRPTTEQYNEPKQESGFGLLGSLKSKLSALDINKIQSTVTTFFDPAYNDTKKEPQSAQESYPYGQQLSGQYSQTQTSNFEIFVPNVEQTSSFYGQQAAAYNQTYDYQVPQQHQRDYNNQMQQKYQDSQLAQHYYQNPQNVGNFFSDADSHRFQSADQVLTTEQSQQYRKQSQEEINAGKQPDIEIQQKYSAFPPSETQLFPAPPRTEPKVPTLVSNQFQKPPEAQQYTTPPNPASNVHTDTTKQAIEQRSFFDSQMTSSEQSLPTIPSNVTTPQNVPSESTSIASLVTNVVSKQPEITDYSIVVADKKDFIDNDVNKRNKPEEPFTTRLSEHVPLGLESTQNKDGSQKDVLSDPHTQIVDKDFESERPHTELTTPVQPLTEKTEEAFRPNMYGSKTMPLESEIRLFPSTSYNIVTKPKIEDRNFSFVDPASFFDIPTQDQSHLEHTPLNLQDKDVGFGAAVSFFDTPPSNALKSQTCTDELLKTIGYKKRQDTDIVNEDVTLKNTSEGDFQNTIPSFQTDPSDFFSSLNPGDNKVQNILSSAFDFNKAEAQEQQKSEVITDWPEETRPLDMSSAPLFGLSTMLANKTKELHDLESEMEGMTNKGSNETSYFEFSKPEVASNDDVPELNICETCREVNKPDEWETEETDDLTTQLIENITSPIQLSNPVEVPLTESNIPAGERESFDNSQCEEISHITEETIEAIQVHAAVELLDDEQKTRDYGWATDDVSTFEKPSLLHDYTLPINPNSIGFFGNMPDKIRTDFEKQENVTRVLPRQMSVPTAPPIEDDSKSEGLDVHSIEQDASKDFPFLEEYVIVPENDDEYPKIDSFTNRVDKYQKHEEDEEHHLSSPLNLSTASPSLPIASYFDTGNYAAETHYRNAKTSPTTNLAFGSKNQVSVPPGFEEEYQMRMTSLEHPDNQHNIPFIPDTSTQCQPVYSSTYTSRRNFTDKNDKDKNDIPYIPETSTQTRPVYSPTDSIQKTFTENIDEKNKITYIPDTSTQTRPICSPTFSTAQVITTYVTTASNVSTIKDRGDLVLPKFEDVFGKVEKSRVVTVQGESLTDSGFIVTDSKCRESKVADLSTVFGKMTLDPTLSTVKDSYPLRAPLPDPINFFGSSTETAQKVGTEDASTNRLASYFSSPAKTDHSKSFFELSQSQNHYRQNSNINTNNLNINVDINITSADVQNSVNIPQEQYIANLNLMRDLTTFQPSDIKPEQIIRTVNYFTIEYDNEQLVQSLINETLKDIPGESFKLEPTEVPSDLTVLERTIRTCKHCCDLSLGYVSTKYFNDNLKDLKFKKCMDNDQGKKDNNIEINDNKMDTRQSISINLEEIISSKDTNDGVVVSNESRSTTEYTPVRHHWFYRIDIDGKSCWRGFSLADNKALEEAFYNPELTDDTLVPTDGGRYDVNIKGRLRVPVYWSDKPTNVRRCSWFYKGTTEPRYVPYSENVAEKLEEEYRHGMTTGEWHRRLVLPNNEMVVMHGPAVMVHFLQTQNTDAFSSPSIFTFGKRVYRNPPKIGVSRDQVKKIDHLVFLVHGAGEYRHQRERIQSTMRPRVVRRGHDESEIEETEPSSINHLLLMCHGVGSACDMRFRNVEEVVDDFRTASLQLIQSHYKSAYDSGKIGRVEVLPISWHATLHSGETGVDKRLARITLESIPRLRSFTNDTVLDVLLYTSPVFCQTIINTVCAELNRIYNLFKKRNPSFTGGVSLGGHSLGSVILYDLLCHQTTKEPSSPMEADKRYVSGVAGTGQSSVRYPQLEFNPTALYALGSPIAIFECIRGVDSLGTDFSLPTCKNFFNIFHPYDPIAYRIEPLINPVLKDYKPFLIPHHKGRKRMHLELKDTMARVGADIKQKLIESFKSTWSSMWKTQAPSVGASLEKVVEEELEKEPMTDTTKEDTIHEPELSKEMLGQLNSGRRVDYVLQEAPFEIFNEYLFAMTSHVCYWESEDTMLLMLREIYDSLGVSPDNTVPQQTLTVIRTKEAQDDTGLGGPDFPSTSKGPS